LLAVHARVDRQWLSSRFATICCLVVILASLTLWFWSVPLLLVLLGVTMNVSNTSANTVLLTTARPLMRGQAISLCMLAMRGGLALGGLLTGISVSLLGVREALLLNGVLALAANLVLTRWIRFDLVVR
jgi:predicted MFS family arabinose efflux permease